MSSSEKQRHNLDTSPSSSHDKDEALVRLASIGQISAGIAHEVKNPLTAVRGFLHLLSEEFSHKYIDVAQAELDRAIATLENLLNVSKPDLDNESYSQLNLASELESILYLFQEKSYDITVKTSFQNTDETIYGKRNLIKRALFNLIKNAFEAVSGDGRIFIGQERVDGYLRIVISDTGSGIPADKVSMLGTPFFTTKPDGTGMGLTQVFSTVYQHNGKIKVDSRVGQGTTFTIDFPLEFTDEVGDLEMDLKYADDSSFPEFFQINKEVFDNVLEQSSSDLLSSLENTPLSREDVLTSAHTLIDLLNAGNEHGLVMEAKKEGKTWAKYDLSMIIKLEWLQKVRRVYMHMVQVYYDNQDFKKKKFFELITHLNFNFDSYVNHFSASFTEFKNDYIKSQNDLINDLTVPVIPLVQSTAILPIIGTVDTHRAKRIQEVVLENISRLRLNRLVIDLSGVAFMDTAVVNHMFRIIEGINLLGCKAVITGLRPEIVNTMIELGIYLTDRVETKATLQQALEEANLVNT